jgi:hypothetical protein
MFSPALTDPFQPVRFCSVAFVLANALPVGKVMLSPMNLGKYRLHSINRCSQAKASYALVLRQD